MNADMGSNTPDEHDIIQPPGIRYVYVIDDDSDLCKSLIFLLATSKITGLVFDGAESFLAELPTLMPAPILLDVRMAGMDGLQALAALRAQGVTWPAIMMTGHGDASTAARAMKLGAIKFLEKPFNIDSLELSLMQAFNVFDEA